MIDCQKVLTTLYEYLDSEVDQQLSIEIKTHIDLCRACFNCCEFEKLLREHLKTKTNPICPEKVRLRIQSIIQKFEIE